MNTVLVLLVVLVYLIQFLWRSHRPGCDSQITLLADNTHSYREGNNMAFNFKTFAAVGALIGSLALVGCGQDEKRSESY